MSCTVQRNEPDIVPKPENGNMVRRNSGTPRIAPEVESCRLSHPVRYH